MRRGLVLLRAEKWAKALAAFEQAGRSLSEDPKVGYGLGISLYYLDRLEESRRWLTKALEKLEDPYWSVAQATLGNIALATGEPQEAVRRLRQAITRGALGEESYYGLGLAFVRVGRPELARRAFAKCASPEFIRQRLRETAEAGS